MQTSAQSPRRVQRGKKAGEKPAARQDAAFPEGGRCGFSHAWREGRGESAGFSRDVSGARCARGRDGARPSRARFSNGWKKREGFFQSLEKWTGGGREALGARKRVSFSRLSHGSAGTLRPTDETNHSPSSRSRRDWKSHLPKPGPRSGKTPMRGTALPGGRHLAAPQAPGPPPVRFRQGGAISKSRPRGRGVDGAREGCLAKWPRRETTGFSCGHAVSAVR